MPGDRYLLYCRQSLTKGDESESLSLAFQERALRLMVAQREGVVVEPVIVDADEKGWDPNRPGLAELERRVASERPDVIAVYAVSRFARDNWLQEGIWRRLKKAAPDVRFESATEPHAEDDLVRGILGVVSQAERRRMGAFLSSSFRERARRGKPHGKTPYGFAKDRVGRLVVNEDARPWVLAIVERLEDGWSLWRVARWLNEEGVDGRTWEPNVVRNTVKTPAIAGCVRTADVETWGAHEPIIDRERWERLCAYLESRRTIRTKSSYSWLEGLIRCGCGAPMHLITHRVRPDPRTSTGVRSAYGQFKCSADPAREQFQRPRNYPACTFRPRSIVQAKAEREVIARLGAMLDTMTTVDAVFARQQRIYAASGPDILLQRKRLEKRLAAANEERDRLLLLYRRGTLDVERWEREDAMLGGKVAGIESEITLLPAEPDRRDIEAIAATLDGLRATFSSAAALAPQHTARIMRALEATAVRTKEGMEIRLPRHFAEFLEDVT